MYTQEYLDYLKSDEWQLKRKEKAEQMNYTCEICGKVVVFGFHIHHKTYRNLFHEPLSDLQFLCEDCHRKLHEHREEIRKKIKQKKDNRVKMCCNCAFSQIIFVGRERKRFLFCQRYLKVCYHRSYNQETGKSNNEKKHNKKKKKKNTKKPKPV
mgnify:FL=1